MKTVGKYTDGDDKAQPRTDGHGWPMDVGDAEDEDETEHESTTTSSGCPLKAMRMLAYAAAIVLLVIRMIGG